MTLFQILESAAVAGPSEIGLGSPLPWNAVQATRTLNIEMNPPSNPTAENAHDHHPFLEKVRSIPSAFRTIVHLGL